MSELQKHLPIFPLNVVLFPNAVLPINVFEDRYKTMVRHCLDGDSRFGIALIKSGTEVGDPAEPYHVGTVANIKRVDQMENGRILLGVKGGSRFRITELTQIHPYLEGAVEVLNDDEQATVTDQDIENTRQLATQYVRLLLGIRGGWVREVEMPSDPCDLSFFVSAMVQVGLPEKQALLEELSVEKRINAGRQIMDRESVALRKKVERTLLRHVRG